MRKGAGQRRRARLDRRVRLLAALDPRRGRRRDARVARLPRRVRRRARARRRAARRVVARLGRRAARRARGRVGHDARVSSTSRRSRSRPATVARRHPPRRRVAARARRAGRASSTGCARPRAASGRACSRSRSGSALAFFNSARHVGRQHVLDPYREDLRPVRDEGLGAYARRVSRPYAEAVAAALRHRQRPRSPSAASSGAPRDDAVKRHRRSSAVGRSPPRARPGPTAARAAGGAAVRPARGRRGVRRCLLPGHGRALPREEETVFPLYARQPTANAELLERVLREHMGPRARPRAPRRGRRRRRLGRDPRGARRARSARTSGSRSGSCSRRSSGSCRRPSSTSWSDVYSAV